MMLQLVDLYALILEYQATAVNYLSKRQLKRAVSTHDWKSLAKSIADLDTGAKTLVPLTQNDVIRRNLEEQLDEIHKSNEALQGIHAILRDSLERDEKADENDLLKLLSVKPYSTKLNDVEARVPGTLEWFLSDKKRFWKWRDSGISDILWVSAGPGFGKSVLSKSLVKDGLLSTKVLTTNVAHFFFKAGDSSRINMTDAMCVLLYQLLKQDQSGKLLQNALTNPHAKGNSSLGQNFEQLWNILVQVASASTSGEIILVLDGLDECTRDDRKAFLHALETFLIDNQKKEDSTVLKFLITSRPYDDFRLNAPTNPLKDYITHFSISDVSNDIDLVIKARVDAVASKIPANSREAFANHLRRGNNRTYLWLSLTFKYINRYPTLFERSEDFERQLVKLPENIEDAYGMLLSTVPDEERSLMLLQIVAGSERPLTVLEANYALALALSRKKFNSHETLKSDLFPADRFEEVIQNYSGFMIEVFDDKLSFLHATAQEFLTTPLDEAKAAEGGKEITPGRKHWQNILGRENPHNTLSKICISYSLIPDCHKGMPQTFDSLYTRYVEKNYPLFRFAADYWYRHFEQQDEHYAKLLLPDAMILCHPSHPVNNREYEGLAYSLRVSYEGESMSPETQCLHMACLQGIYRLVDYILSTPKSSVDVNKRLNDMAPLSQATERGHHEVAKRLLADPRVKAQNKDFHFCDRWDDKSEFFSSIINIPGLLERLESNPFDEEFPGLVFLSHACETGDLGILNLLLEVPAISTYVKGVIGLKALGIALFQTDETFNIQIVKKLLNTIDASTYDDHDDEADDGEETPLILACLHNRKDVVELLVKTPGVDINKTNSATGYTALMMATSFGNEAIVKILLDVKDIKVDSMDIDGESALLISLSCDYNASIVEALCAANNIEPDDKVNATKTVREALLDFGKSFREFLDDPATSSISVKEYKAKSKAFNQNIEDYKELRRKRVQESCKGLQKSFITYFIDFIFRILQELDRNINSNAKITSFLIAHLKMKCVCVR